MQDRLTSLGMTAYEDPPLEPSYACMALVTPPQGPPSQGVIVREAKELSDFVAIGELATASFGITGDDRVALIENMKKRYELRKDKRFRVNTYLALIDGELVGEAQAVMTDTGTNLSGSTVAASARGRGVYRALVAARWEEAVARGLPALTVQAGHLSRPILERLGFQTVDTQLVLCDRFE
jgi:GNAT superfamily N-acetyltransferase